jgi:hypothetical protein
VLTHFFIQGLGESDQAELRRRVGSAISFAGFSGNRADIDDGSLTLFNHPGDKRLGENDRGAEIESQRLIQIVTLYFDDRRALPPTGIVDQDIRRSPSLLALLDKPLNLIVMSQVRGNRDCLPAACLYFLLNIFELGHRASRQDDPAPGRCQIRSNSPADSAAGAGDNGYFSC